MRWYVPSFAGDFRLEPQEGNRCVLIVEKPTPFEQNALTGFLKKGVKKWLERGTIIPERWPDTVRFVIEKSLAKVGPMLVRTMKPKDRTITAVRYENGALDVASTGEDLDKLAEKAAADKTAKAIASVSRPTPSCPQCTVDAVGPASEVLLSFLDEKEHANWATSRAIIVRGGQTGFRYLLAHRNTPLAARIGRICYDIDNRAVVHFHDRMVPPEEEVLAAKLILEHRELWLRNEATMFSAPPDTVFKNPFGDIHDGVWDANFTAVIGEAALMLRGLAAAVPTP